MKAYIAGPMTGLPELNYPAFHAEAARLRALGWEVINPAENPPQPSWHAYMRISVAQLAGCTLVAVLPGWHNSRGAKIEIDLADDLGIPVHRVDAIRSAPGALRRGQKIGPTPTPTPTLDKMEAWASANDGDRIVWLFRRANLTTAIGQTFREAIDEAMGHERKGDQP